MAMIKCKVCGNEYSDRAEECPYCRENNDLQNTPIQEIIIPDNTKKKHRKIAYVLLIALNLFFAAMWIEAESRYDNLLSDLQETETELQQLDSAYLDLGLHCSVVESQLEFYENNAVAIYVGDFSKYYHKVLNGCSISSNYSDYYIFNNEAARARGYVQCPDCFIEY